MFTVTLSAAQLDRVRSTFAEDADMLAALGTARKKVVRAKTATAPVEAFVPNTGDPALDAFMRRNHNQAKHDKRIAAFRKMVAGPVLKPKKMTDGQREDALRFAEVAVSEWKRRGYEVVIEPVEIVDGGRAVMRERVTVDWRNVRVLPKSPATQGKVAA